MSDAVFTDLRTALPSEPAARRRERAPGKTMFGGEAMDRMLRYELLRLYAANRANSAIAFGILVFASCIAAGMLMPPQAAAVAGAAVAASFGIGTAVVVSFLRKPAGEVDLDRWRRRFIVAEILQGLAWASFIFVGLHSPGEGARTFALVVHLLVSAAGVMLGASVPVAVIAGIAPLLGGVIAIVVIDPNVSNVALAMVMASAQTFFLFMTGRLSSSVERIVLHRAEKDALIAELEQSNANSEEARRRAEESNLAKSRFLATMSHELRTPLNAILGFSEVMKGELLGRHSVAAYREYSEDVHASGEMLLNIINEILDLSRIEAGRYELNESCVSLPDVVSECCRLLQLRAVSKRIEIEQTTEPELSGLWADERALRQIALNILSNAIKFTPNGGDIRIRIGSTAEGGQFVSVQDSGPGIPESEIPVIMQTFGRGTLAIKSAEQGTGLGLPIVKGLVELHGGRFELISRSGEGTLAMIVFPPARLTEPAAPALPGRQAARARAA